MAFNVKLGNSGSAINVKFDNSSSNFTLKNQVGSGQRMDTLADVDTTISSANGSILVYNNTNDKYEQRDILTFDNEQGAFKLDGGSF